MQNTGNRLKSFNAGVGSDGEVTFKFQRADNTQASISVPFNDLADFIIGLEMQAGAVLAKLNAATGGDRRMMLPIKKRAVTKVQGGVTNGVPILTLVLDGRIPLDLAIPPNLSLELIEYLQELQSQANRALPKSN